MLIIYIIKYFLLCFMWVNTLSRVQSSVDLSIVMCSENFPKENNQGKEKITRGGGRSVVPSLSQNIKRMSTHNYVLPVLTITKLVLNQLNTNSKVLRDT